MADNSHSPEENLEDKLKAAHADAANAHADAGHGKETKNPATTLESVVNETKELFGKSFDIGLGLGAAAATTSFLGTRNGAGSLSSIVDKGRDGIVVPLSYAAGEKYVQKKNFTTAHFRNEMISGGLQTAAIIYPAYKYMNMAQQAIVNAVSATSYSQHAAAAGIVGRSILNVPLYFPPAILGYYIIDHLVKKRTFRGLYSETIKPNFKSDLKNAYKYLGIPVLLNALLMPAALQVPGAAVLTFAYKLLMSGKQKKKEESPADDGPGYISSGISGASKFVSNTAKGLSESVSALGTSLYSGLKKMYSGAAKSVTPPSTPATTPAH